MTPNVFRIKEIKDGKEVIGRINLVLYQRQGIPHIEFELDEGFRGKGIMSSELPKYLKKFRCQGGKRLIAVVNKDNQASIKVLEKNKFIKIATFDDVFGYVIAFDLMEEIKEFQKKALKSMVQNLGSF